jgi:Uma2 family endonuclease
MTVFHCPRFFDPLRRSSATIFRSGAHILRHAAELPSIRRRDDTMAMSLTRHFTAADLATMPDDGQRYEVVRGELLVTPAPGLRHQRILTRLFVILHRYLSANGLEQLLWSPADISFDADTSLQPDLFVADFGAASRANTWSDLKRLHLAIEGVSPSSAAFDRGIKRKRYQEARVPEYWVGDDEKRQVEVWTPDAGFPVVQRERLLWRHPDLNDVCTVDLINLFE